MSDAKISIQTIADDSGIKDLSSSISQANDKLKVMRKDLKEVEEKEGAASEAAKKLRAEITAQRAAISQGNKSLRQMASELSSAGKQAGGTKDALTNMITEKLGFNLTDITSKMTTMTGKLMLVATAAAAVGTELVKLSREMSAYSNQFIAFTGSAKGAQEMYDKFNEVYRNTNYDEQKVYDMAKGLMAVKVGAGEAADLITKCSDAAAGLGKGVEFTEQLVDTFKRLATGGEMSKMQIKALSDAGLDLSDIQDQLSKGGQEAYEALKDKLAEYEGGMSQAKQTSAEMEGDIKGNLVEIGRQTALLIDDIFNFSGALKSFYQWIIDVSQACIDGLKRMRQAFNEANASAADYASARARYDKLNGPIADDDYEALAKRDYELAQIVKHRQEEREEIQATTEAYKKLNELPSFKGAVTSAEKTGSSGGSKSSSNKADTEALKAKRKLEQDIAKINQEIIKYKEQAYQLGLKHTETVNKQAQIGKYGLELEKLKYEQDMARYDEQIRKQQELTDAKIKAVTDEAAAVQKAIADGTAPDGSQAKIDKLMEEKAIIEAIGAQQIANIEAERDARSAEYNDTSGLLNQDPGNGLSVDTLNGMSQALQMVKSKWSDFVKVIGTDTPQLKLAINTIATPFANMAQSIIMGTKSAGEAMRDFVKQMIVQALNLLAQWLTIFALVSAFQGPVVGARVATKMVLGVDSSGGIASSAGSSVSSGFYDTDIASGGHATGGMIYGPGTSTSDSIPAMLSNGEAVLNASAVNAIGGASAVNAINSGDLAAMGGGQSVTLNISAVDASGFGDFLARGGLQTIKQALVDDNRSFGLATTW